MIDLRNVTKVYSTKNGPHTVLWDVSLRFPPRTNVGILGRNGAGKSTLLRIISGVELPDSGSVERQGRISWPIGFSGGFNGSLSAEENCRFVARIFGEDVDHVVGFTKAFAEIGHYFHMPMKTYSTGMKSRVAFGLSMAIDFEVYLVDEVTAAGDAGFQKKCREAFAERRERSSVIMVSHSMKIIQEYCDCCAVLKAGNLTLYGSIAEANRAYASRN